MVHERAQAVLDRIPKDRRVVGAEIGVLSGRTSAALLRMRPKLFLYLVDPWKDHGATHRYEKSGGVSPARGKGYPQSWWDERYQATLKVTDFAKARRTALRMHSAAAAPMIEDGGLDFVYLDADHTLEACIQDIALWWPKIKSGGFLCGHDYDHPDKRWGVKEAVDAFVQRVQLPLDRGIDMTWFVHRPGLPGKTPPPQKEKIDGTSSWQTTQTLAQKPDEETPPQEEGHEEALGPDTIVLACGGPSLCNVDWSALPFPVAAINKAIWVTPRFDYWFIADGYPEKVYKDRWKPIAADPRIAKCVPRHRLETGYRNLKRVARNLHAAPVSQGRTQDKTMASRGRHLFDRRTPFFYLENKTTLFATQWLATGYRRLIYVGCELTFKGTVGSCIGSDMAAGEVNQMRKNLELVKRGLQTLHVAAVKRGIEMLSFSPGPINDIIPRYEP